MSNNVIIIGAGPAGLTAAIYLGRSGIKSTVITGDSPGGQLAKTGLVENYPGFAKPILGSDLMAQMMEQTTNFGAEFLYDTVSCITNSLTSSTVVFDTGNSLTGDALLIATGCSNNKLNIPGETEFSRKGVSWCATCDGPLFRNKKVAVIGGGNSAIMEALFLSNFASEVLLVHRRDELRADKHEQEKLFKNPKIRCIWNSEVTEILGSTKVESIEIFDKQSKSRKIEIIDGIFIAIGNHPATSFVKGLIDLDSDGYIIADKTKTSVHGIYAAGDIVSGAIKQAVYAAGQGALAARMIEKQLGIR